jgi:hypothetical protein
MDLYNTTLIESGSCTNEIVGFGVALGVSLASSIASCALLYMCYIKPKPPQNPHVPIAERPLTKPMSENIYKPAQST